MTELHEKKAIIEAAIKAERALAWLVQYGPIHPQGTKENIGATVHMNYASACGGSKEAKIFLEKAMSHLFPEINSLAIKLAKEALEKADD